MWGGVEIEEKKSNFKSLSHGLLNEIYGATYIQILTNSCNICERWCTAVNLTMDSPSWGSYDISSRLSREEDLDPL